MNPSQRGRLGRALMWGSVLCFDGIIWGAVATTAHHLWPPVAFITLLQVFLVGQHLDFESWLADR